MAIAASVDCQLPAVRGAATWPFWHVAGSSVCSPDDQNQEQEQEQECGRGQYVAGFADGDDEQVGALRSCVGCTQATRSTPPCLCHPHSTKPR